MYNSKVRNIELPENLFSNLGESKSKTLIQKKKILEENDNLNSFKEDYLKENNTKLMNFTKQKEYRDRIDKMYENIKSITPIDNEIDNVLYFNNYQEKGIVVKPKVVSLKQFWTEYRLINNEKHFSSVNKNNIDINKKLSDFDKLFEDSMEFDPMDVWEDTDEDNYKIKTTVENLEATTKGLENMGYVLKSAELTRIPSNSNELTDVNIAKKVMLLLEKLDEHDDVQNVYSNFEADDEIMNAVDI